MDNETQELITKATAKFEEGIKDAKAAADKLTEIETTLKALQDGTTSKVDFDAAQKSVEEKLKEVKDFMAAQGRKGNAEQVHKTFGGMIYQLVGECEKALGEMATRGKEIGAVRKEFDRKAVTDMTLVNNLVGDPVKTYRTGFVEHPYWPVHFRDLVAVTPSATDTYVFYRHTTSEGTIAFQTDETAIKAKIDEDYIEVIVNLNYLAGWLKVSRKMLRNLPGLQGQLSRWLPERYYQAEDAAAYAALSGSAGLTTPVAGSNNINSILLTQGAIEDKGYTVNGIVMRPSAWANLMTNASTDGIYTLPGSVVLSPQGGLQIVGMPIVKALWVPANTAVIGDWSKFEIVQSEALSLRISQENENDFIRNMMTALIEASIGFAMLDPAAFSIIPLDAPTT